MSSGTGGGGQGGTDEFLAEAAEIVERLQAGISSLDEGHRAGRVSPSQLNDVFRAAHSLKGLAGIFGVDTLVALAHEFENLLHGMRLGKVELTGEILNTLYESGEAFGLVLRDMQSGVTQDSAVLTDLTARLQAASTGETETTDDPLRNLGLPDGMLSVLTEYEEHRLIENVRNKVPLFLLNVIFALETFDDELTSLSDILTAHGELLTTLPGSEAPAGRIAFALLFASRAAKEDWEHQLTGDVDIQQVSRRASHAPTPPQEVEVVAAERETASSGPIGDSIRVDIRKLDGLMNVVGELALVHAEVTRALHDLRMVSGSQRVVLDLQKTTRTFERHLAELQQGIMNVRMVPLHIVFERLARTVRRISREVNKEVRFRVSGEDTEFDKVIIEELSDPLLHLVRNSLDHGIEPAEVRQAIGKPATGTITVHAFPKGRHVVIEVSDDGSGLDEVAIRRIALEKGLVDEERVGTMTQRELWGFIFHPGFSTRREVTEVSGRGVGMDVVKTNIGRLSGVIDVNSTPGAGTQFTITLPITLAIVQALVVETGTSVFALPLSSVLEIRVLEEYEVKTIEGREVIFGRDETIPLLWLSDVFRLPPPEEKPAQRHVVIVGLARNRLGIVVDDLIGQQDIIIKPMGRLLRRVKGIAGATDLGTGRLVLVLDIGELVEEALVSVQAAVGLG